MRVIETVRELSALADVERGAGRRVALVPTMGALHAGHRALVDEARKRADRVWVSVFVNPAQFDEASDFEGYPRERERDLALCREAGVDVVFEPSVEELYPAGAATWVEVDRLAEPLCGATRPGHFRGVATVVTKLLAAARPHEAVFGQKDYQQLAVVRRLARDLCLGTRIVGVPTVREADGLALSSRNVRLGPGARREATVLVRSLDAAEQAWRAGERGREALLRLVREELGRAPRATVDYAELRDPATLELSPDPLCGPALLALAVRFPPDPDGRGAAVRLIDNRVLGSRDDEEDRG